ncbi:unnamed protein product [Tetraodon nigroviridis]|uniref:(spotted green pufferfish) hypothetical protein n=1 Tax=Tetraodon nigroviridis TaxID=99883 RepID=Q4T682_TETNG|nr:unnamed protein product [Tetraodon nigroviridis]
MVHLSTAVHLLGGLWVGLDGPVRRRAGGLGSVPVSRRLGNKKRSAKKRCSVEPVCADAGSPPPRPRPACATPLRTTQRQPRPQAALHEAQLPHQLHPPGPGRRALQALQRQQDEASGGGAAAAAALVPGQPGAPEEDHPHSAGEASLPLLRRRAGATLPGRRGGVCGVAPGGGVPTGTSRSRPVPPWDHLYGGSGTGAGVLGGARPPPRPCWTTCAPPCTACFRTASTAPSSRTTTVVPLGGGGAGRNWNGRTATLSWTPVRRSRTCDGVGRLSGGELAS